VVIHSNISRIFEKHGVNYTIYADDIQFWISFRVDELQTVLQKVSDCVIDLKSWLSANFLLLNESKTEIIILDSPQLLSRITI
jgi:hypothetical protein